MEAKVVSPVAIRLFAHVETGREPQLLRRVIRVESHLLLHWQPEELVGDPQHLLHGLLGYPMINNLHKHRILQSVR